MRAPPLPLLLLPLLLLVVPGAGALPAPRGRRQAPESAGAAGGDPPGADPELLSRHLQPLSELFRRQLRLEELRSQAEAYVDRANKQLAPLAQEIQNSVRDFFSSLFAPPQPDGRR